jgi:hypothetical protein
MKRYIGIIVATVMVISTFLPITAVADDIYHIPTREYGDEYRDYDMTVNLISSGGGNNTPPVIKAKFETSQSVPRNNNYHEHDENYFDDDLTLAGTQVDPPMKYNGETWVGYYVFVFDPDGNEEIDQVYVDVFHPDPNTPNNGSNPIGDGSLKYNIVLSELTITQDILDFFEAVHENETGGNNIICYNPGYDWADLWHELVNGQLKVYYGHKQIHYCQPAGYYKVVARAYDTPGDYGELTNYFEYVLGVGISTDFSHLDFGDAKKCVWKWIFGDWSWGGDPTIRNIGNWDVQVSLEFDDFGMGQSDFDGDTEWNVEFDVRLGDTNGALANRSYTEKMYDFLGGDPTTYNCSIHPDTEVILPSDYDPRQLYTAAPDDISNDYFTLCHTAKISFGIHIRKNLDLGVYGVIGDGPDVGDNDLTIGVHVPLHAYEFLSGLPCASE